MLHTLGLTPSRIVCLAQLDHIVRLVWVLRHVLRDTTALRVLHLNTSIHVRQEPMEMILDSTTRISAEDVVLEITVQTLELQIQIF